MEYTDLFESEGYFSSEDVENLKQLTEDDLRDMGITKRGNKLYNTVSHISVNRRIVCDNLTT